MSAGATGAIAAAAAARRRRVMETILTEEEEGMTQYTPDELDDDWEFKVVRSTGAAFRKPEELEKLIEEEARAGWVMLEKFDSSRVRFKRPRSARAKDPYLPPDVDPYRTYYGSTFGQPALIVTLIAFGMMILLGLAVLGLVIAFAR
jgi:hypothetical protein